MSTTRALKQFPQLPSRPAGGHKGLFGRVLIVGGSEGMIGAPAFAALASLRMGCGLAYIASERPLLPHVLSVAPEAVGIAASPGDFAAYERALATVDAIAAGPGLGQSDFAVDLLKRAMEARVPLILDADALNLIASGKLPLRRSAHSAVLTPHPGEMQRLASLFGRRAVPDDEKGRIRMAMEAARHFEQVLVLKGHRTIVADGVGYAVNRTGDSTLSKAGAGDILSGMLVALLGQKLPPMDAARLAVYYHGRAGELAGERLGRRAALARDVIACIADALKASRK